MQQLELEASRATRLCGHQFGPGDRIKAILSDEVDLNDGIGRGGAWGWRGFTSQWIDDHAIEIIELEHSNVILNRRPDQSYRVSSGSHR